MKPEIEWRPGKKIAQPTEERRPKASTHQAHAWEKPKSAPPISDKGTDVPAKREECPNCAALQAQIDAIRAKTLARTQKARQKKTGMGAPQGLKWKYTPHPCLCRDYNRLRGLICSHADGAASCTRGLPR